MYPRLALNLCDPPQPPKNQDYHVSPLVQLYLCVLCLTLLLRYSKTVTASYEKQKELGFICPHVVHWDSSSLAFLRLWIQSQQRK